MRESASDSKPYMRATLAEYRRLRAEERSPAGTPSAPPRATTPPPPVVEVDSRSPTTPSAPAPPASDSLAMYLREIARVPLLTAAEEADLGRRIRLGQRAQERLLQAEAAGVPLDAVIHEKLESAVVAGQMARMHLTRANLRLVVSIAKRYATSRVPLGDLIQEGNFGLMRAVEKFDYRRGFKFSTYASWWIRQAINRGVTEHSRSIRLPAHMADQLRRYVRVRLTLQQRLGREPHIEEVAMGMGILDDGSCEAVRAARLGGDHLTPELQADIRRACARVEQLSQVAMDPISLEAPVGEDTGSVVGDFVSDSQTLGLCDMASRNILGAHLRSILQELSEREREVLEMRFGLNGDPPRTLEDIGSAIGVSRERVRQIECRALRKLRQPSRSDRLKDYLGS